MKKVIISASALSISILFASITTVVSAVTAVIVRIVKKLK